MIRAVFAILIAINALRAWRRSPEFTWRRFWLMLGATALGVALLVGAVTIVAEVSSRLPQNLQLAAVFAVVALAIAGMIAAIMELSAGRIDRVAGARPFRAHRARLVPWILALVAALAALSVAAWLVPPEWQEGVITFGALLLMLGLSLLVTLYIVAGWSDRSTAALMAAPWFRWRIADAAWQAWTAAHRKAEQATARRALREAAFVLAGAGLLLLVVLVVTIPGVVIPLLIVVVTFAMIGLLLWRVLTADERRYRRLAAGESVILFGPAGFVLGNDFMPWSRAGIYLVEARCQPGPVGPELMLRFMVSSGTSQSRKSRFVPMPPSPDADLAVLQRELPGRCRNAVVMIQPQPA